MQEVNRETVQDINREAGQEPVPQTVSEAIRETDQETHQTVDQGPVLAVDQESAQASLPEEEIFRGYEVKSWNFNPRIYKILAVSAIFNIVSLILFAQSNLLTTKGCDSPFVGTVCQVIDTVYVGTKIFGGDSEYGEGDVPVTEIGKNDEIIFINETGDSPPLDYPEGYFAVANPEKFYVDADGVTRHVSEITNFTDPTTINPTITNPTTINPTPVNPTVPDLMKINPTRPRRNKSPLIGDVPDKPSSVGEDPTTKDPTTANNGKDYKSPGKLPKIGEDGKVADNQNNKDGQNPPDADSIEDITTYKVPFENLAEFVSAKWSFKPGNPESKIDLKPFKVALNGKLVKKTFTDEEGKEKEIVAFDGDKTKWIDIKPEEAGDPEMVEIAKKAVEAVGNSGFLGHLYNLGLKDVKISLVQAGDKIVVNLESEQPTEERAKTLASGLNGLMVVANKTVKDGTNERILLDSAMKTPPKNVGKKIILNVEFPVDLAKELIRKNLESEAQKKQEKKDKPNSTALTANSNVKTGK
ncbi:MAG: hypothetical protein R2747_12775 [Pyrinomonadaceae bacterium]